MDKSKKVTIWRRQRRRERGGSGKLVVRILAGLFVFAFLVNLAIVFISFGAAAGVYAYFAQDLPDPEKIETEQEDFETTKIYDRTGQHLLYEVFDPRPYHGDRTYMPLDQIPLVLREATVALEDRSFYENPGINIRGLFRAFYNNLRGLSVQGGSSITQQLVKKVLIPYEEQVQQSYARKIKETIMALEISRRYAGKDGKDQILEWYLNYNSYGNFAYGVEAAAQVYYSKSVAEIDLAEAAMLAAIPQYPGLNPIDNPEWAKQRQRIVLDQMVVAGYISQAEADQAFAQELVIRATLATRFEGTEAPHFSIYVRKMLEDKYGPDVLYGGGLRVFTTIDLDIQHEIERVARARVKEMQEDTKYVRNVSNAAVVVMRPRTGEILGMMGSLDHSNAEIDGQVNITLADRQPGSSFKPFTYLTLFSQGYSAATMVMDVRTSFPDPPSPVNYVPENYDRAYHGPVRLRNALANSYNIPAVWALSKAGVKNAINTAHRMGINTLLADFYGLSLTLGGGEVRLIDMTYAFSVLANGGTMAGEEIAPADRRAGFRELDPVAILRVEDRYGNVLEAYETPQTREILPPELAYLMNDILSDNAARLPAFGVNNRLHLEDRPVAAKTGTTDGWKDAWALGYTPQYVTGVWVGNADNASMDHVPGSYGAAPIWNDIMTYLHDGEPVETFVRPRGLEEVEVCAISGKLPTEHCPNRVKELFIMGTAPVQHCDVHQAFRVNKETGKLATVYTPPELVEERVYEIYPPEAADWIRTHAVAQPPRVYDDAYGPGPATGNVAIIEPAAYAYVGQGMVIVGNARSDNFRMWRLEYGAGLNPITWSQIGGDRYDQIDRGPLEYWDVSGMSNGLYTLQLRVVRQDGGVEDAAIQVTVDTISPTATLIHPEDGDLYRMEDAEWVNVQVDATDNAYMDRVDFFLDGDMFASSTVAPYNEKWTIVMSDTLPVGGLVITRTEPITDGVTGAIIGEQVITETEVLTEVLPSGDLRYTQWFESGRGIISDTVGYTETHVIHVIAYDAAGNQIESEKVRIYVMHREEDKEEGASPTVAMWFNREMAFLGDDRPAWLRSARPPASN